MAQDAWLVMARPTRREREDVRRRPARVAVWRHIEEVSSRQSLAKTSKTMDTSSL
uniref:Uncharacterized protein n=1 Tax=Oryza sativa subsp. japonica TaxID=39947 RepID=Q6H6Q8_ORYSJ|nr:hypothetical protein [Oryza sativa Japonica Group]BAD25591.1 hypothetical protein [Oryza sativa Japonica Group]